jgi:hypothetical protein
MVLDLGKLDHLKFFDLKHVFKLTVIISHLNDLLSRTDLN